LDPKRRFVKEGELKRFKKNKAKKYYFYQFNDLLIFGTLAKGKYSLSGMIPFATIENLSQKQDSILFFVLLFIWLIHFHTHSTRTTFYGVCVNLSFTLLFPFLKSQTLLSLHRMEKSIC
jgi:hypothetical protein